MMGWIVYGGTADVSPEGKDGHQSFCDIIKSQLILDFSMCS